MEWFNLDDKKPKEDMDVLNMYGEDIVISWYDVKDNYFTTYMHSRDGELTNSKIWGYLPEKPTNKLNQG